MDMSKILVFFVAAPMLTFGQLVKVKFYPEYGNNPMRHDSPWAFDAEHQFRDPFVNQKRIVLTIPHGRPTGASGRFERFKEVALEYAFLLSLEGITK